MSQELIPNVMLFSILAIASYHDIKTRTISNKFNIRCFIIATVMLMYYHPHDSCNYILAAIVGSGILFLTALLSNGKIGGGDIKFYVVIGLILGVEKTLLSILLMSFFLLLFFVFAALAKGKESLNQSVPLAPFMMLGVLAIYVLERW